MMQTIEVWRDSVGDPTDPVWCVSLCRASDHSEIKTMSIHGTLESAMNAARAAASVRGVVAYHRINGDLERIV